MFRSCDRNELGSRTYSRASEFRYCLWYLYLFFYSFSQWFFTRSSCASVNVLAATLRQELLRQSGHNLSYWDKRNAGELWILLGLFLTWGGPDFTSLSKIRRHSRRESRAYEELEFNSAIQSTETISEGYLVPRTAAAAIDSTPMASMSTFSSTVTNPVYVNLPPPVSKRNRRVGIVDDVTLLVPAPVDEEETVV